MLKMEKLVVSGDSQIPCRRRRAIRPQRKWRPLRGGRHLKLLIGLRSNFRRLGCASCLLIRLVGDVGEQLISALLLFQCLMQQLRLTIESKVLGPGRC
jgi:hypothetical protein